MTEPRLPKKYRDMLDNLRDFLENRIQTRRASLEVTDLVRALVTHIYTEERKRKK